MSNVSSVGHGELEDQLFSSSLLRLWLTGADAMFSQQHEEDDFDVRKTCR